MDYRRNYLNRLEEEKRMLNHRRNYLNRLEEGKKKRESTPSSSYSPSSTSTNAYIDPGKKDPYFDQKYLTPTQKKIQSNALYGNEYSEKTRKEKRKEIERKLQYDPSNVSKEELDFYEGRTDKIEFKEFSTEENQEYYKKENNKNAIDYKVALKEIGKEEDTTFYSGAVEPETFTEYALNHVDEFKKTVFIPTDLQANERVDWKGTFEGYKNQGKDKVIVRYNNQWVHMPIDKARALLQPETLGDLGQVAKFNLKNKGFKNISEGISEGTNQAFQGLDAFGEANRSGILKALQEDGINKEVGKAWLDGLKGSLNGDISSGKQDTVLGKHILDEMGWEKDSSEPWYGSLNNFAHATTGFGIDAFSGILPTGAGRKVVTQGAEAVGKLTSRQLDDLVQQISKQLPNATNETQEMILKEVVEKAKQGNFNLDDTIKQFNNDWKTGAANRAKNIDETIDPNNFNIDKHLYETDQYKKIADGKVMSPLTDESDFLMDVTDTLNKTYKQDQLFAHAPEWAKGIFGKVDDALYNSKIGQNLRKTIDEKADIRLKNQQNGQFTFGDKVMSKVNKNWNIDPRIVDKANDLLADNRLNKVDLKKRLDGILEGVSKEERIALTDYISGVHEKDPQLWNKYHNISPDEIDKEKAQALREMLDEMGIKEDIKNMRTNYATHITQLSDNKQREIINNFLEGKVDNANEIIGNLGNTFNPHEIGKVFDTPREWFEFINEQLNHGKLKKTDINKIVNLDPKATVLKRSQDHADIMSNKELREYAKKLGYNGEKGTIPKHIKDYIDQFAKKENPMNTNWAVRNLIDKPTNTWKRAVMNSPIGSGVVARNIAGGSVNNYYDMGLKDTVKNTGKSLGFILNDSLANGYLGKGLNKVGLGELTEGAKNRTFNIGDKKLTIEELNRLMTEGGIGNSMLKQELDDGLKNAIKDDWNDLTTGEKIKRGLNTAANPLSSDYWAWRLGGTVNEGAEKTVRGARFLKGLDEYGANSQGARQAGKDAENVHFNYNSDESLSKFENDVLKRIFPFYTFQRFNTPYGMQQMLKNPNRVNRVNYAMEEMNNEEGDTRQDPYFPDFLKKAGIHLANGEYFNANFLPMNDVKENANIFDKAVSSASPYLKTLANLGLMLPIVPSEMRDRQVGSGMDLSGARNPVLGQDLARFSYENMPEGFNEMMGIFEDKNGNMKQKAAQKYTTKDLFPNISRLGGMVESLDKDFNEKGIEGTNLFEKIGDLYQQGGGDNFFKKAMQLMAGLGKYEANPEMNQSFELQRDVQNLETDIRESNHFNMKGAPKENQSPDYMRPDLKEAEKKYYKDLEDFTKWKEIYDEGYQPVHKTSGYVYDLFGNKIDYKPRNKSQATEEKYNEAKSKVYDGQIQSKKDWERFTEYYKNGFPEIERYFEAYNLSDY